MAGKRALVISGGGQRGSFGVGAAAWLMDALGLQFDVFTGTSTGSLIVSLLAAGGKAAIPELVRQYTTVKTSDIIKPRYTNPLKLFPLASVYLTDPLRKRVEAGITQPVFEQIRDSGRQLVITTVDLETGRIVYFTMGPPIVTDSGDVVPITSRDQLVDAMVASASIPFFMPPVKIARGGKPDPMVDGGVREYAPIEVAIHAGADEIYCLVLMPPRDKLAPKPGKYDGIIDITQRTVDLLSQEVGESDIKLSSLYSDAIDFVDAVRTRLKQEIPASAAQIDTAFAETPGSPFAGKVAVRLHVIRPQKPLEGDTLKFDPTEMQHNLVYGCQVARDAFPRPDLPTDWCDKLLKG